MKIKAKKLANKAIIAIIIVEKARTTIKAIIIVIAL